MDYIVGSLMVRNHFLLQYHCFFALQPFRLSLPNSSIHNVLKKVTKTIQTPYPSFCSWYGLIWIYFDIYMYYILYIIYYILYIYYIYIIYISYIIYIIYYIYDIILYIYIILYIIIYYIYIFIYLYLYYINIFDQCPTTHPLSFPLGSAALGTRQGLGPFGALPKKPARPAERSASRGRRPWSCVEGALLHIFELPIVVHMWIDLVF